MKVKDSRVTLKPHNLSFLQVVSKKFPVLVLIDRSLIRITSRIEQNSSSLSKLHCITFACLILSAKLNFSPTPKMSHVLQAKVKSVLSGDTLILVNAKGVERQLSLAYISAPRLRREGDEVSLYHPSLHKTH